ncbi:hypothetical protein CTAYLR_009743 [Chrysophaeum taylorii]|uniref:HECT-type E3 ubiquitin transferase n=1 Tax=Chrysophaeum taylorii TaxID=2483200 RepID=A0AAD7UKS6_9STRA|nr:hypothetical protein CTAYLR_009743 [Chrysophaeum taylorii]
MVCQGGKTSLRSHRVVELGKGKLCLIGGFVGEFESASDVWVCDGVEEEEDEGGSLRTTWSVASARAEFRGRDGHAAVVVAGCILVLGGASSDVDALTTSEVWKSEDEGATWRLVTSAPGWPARTHHEAVVFDGAVVLLGGFGEFGYCNDVWKSLDGSSTWERATAAAAWSARAMHAATVFRGAVYVAGGYEGRGSCNDVWASTDATTWTRLAHRAPWRARRGHSLVAAGSSCLVVAGGESGAAETANNETFGDCWTSHDGATWTIVCLDAPPRHLHAAACRSDGLLLVFGGAEAVRGGAEATTHVHADAWALSLDVARSPPQEQQSRATLDISMRSAVAAVAELKQLRAALREVQSGNVQLAQDATEATSCEPITVALHGPRSATQDEPPPVKQKKTTPASLGARLQRVWATAYKGGFFDSTSSSSGSKPAAAEMEGNDEEDNDSVSLIRDDSYGSFFDARERDSDSSERAVASSPVPSPQPRLPALDEEPQPAPIATESMIAATAAPPGEAMAAVIADVFAIDAALGDEWRDALWPSYREIQTLALGHLDQGKLAACVERRDAALEAAVAEATTAETRFAALQAESDRLQQKVALAIARLRARLAVELEDGSALGARNHRPPRAIKDSVSFADLKQVVLESTSIPNDASRRRDDERDPSSNDSRRAEDDEKIDDWPSIETRASLMIAQREERDDADKFEDVAADLRAHCTRPERADSARRATDAALNRLADALQKRADAADALRASIHYVATNKQENDDSTKLEEEVSRGTLAAAVLWDEGTSLVQAKLDAHAAVGNELAVIPRELEHALALKARLLRAAERRCSEAYAGFGLLAAVASRLRRRAATWRAYLGARNQAALAAALCDAAAAARNAVVAIEDLRTDTLSALEKLARRRRANFFKPPPPPPMPPPYSSILPAAEAVEVVVPEQSVSPTLSLATGVIVARACANDDASGDGGEQQVLSTSAVEFERRDAAGTTSSSSFTATTTVRKKGDSRAEGILSGVFGGSSSNAQLFLCRRTRSVEMIAEEDEKAAIRVRPSTLQDAALFPPSPDDDDNNEKTEARLRQRVHNLDAELVKARRARRRAVARAARYAYTVAPEVVWESPVIVDSLGRFNLLGLDERDDDEDLYLTDAASQRPHRRASTDGAGAWVRSPNRDLAEYAELEPFSRGDSPRSLRGMDRASGDAVLLKAYALDESDRAEWWLHEAEMDALLALPRHEAIAAPRSMVTATWAPVPPVATSCRGRVERSLRGGSSSSSPEGGGEQKNADTPRRKETAAMMYLEFALAETDSVGWASAAARAPWHVQAVARQVLTALLVLHSHDVVHAHLSPRAVVVVGESRAQLSTRHLPVAHPGEEELDEREFVAPEVVRGETAPTAAADVYSFGATLGWLHRRSAAEADALQRIPSMSSRLSSLPDVELHRLLESLMASEASERPTAADAMLHPYFQNSYMDRYIAGGDIVGPNEKLEALRDLLRRVRSEMRSLPGRRNIVVRRETIVDDVLSHFSEQQNDRRPGQHHATRWPLKVTFEGEAGVDEGGLTVEMFRLFFDQVLEESRGLFESSGGDVVLPRPPETAADPRFLAKLEAFGRSLVTACYEGCGAPSKLGPSLFKFLARGARHVSAGDSRALRDLQKFDPQLGASLEYMLTHSPNAGTDWGLDFDDVSPDDHQPRPVTEANKHSFVVLKVRRVLTGCRHDSLLAIRRGFETALSELSPEASPFLKLFSSTDWRVMLCSDQDDLRPEQVLDVVQFINFNATSIVPDAFRRTIESISTDSLRRFLVFATGAPSLPNDLSDFKLQVRAQPRSNALPVAHVCFYHLDIPDYADENQFITKFMMAIHEASTFERV